MTRLKHFLLASACALGLAVIALPALVFTQDVNCGGSFTPSFNCVITGLWDYTSTATSAYPVPFLVQGAEVSGAAPAIVDLTNAQVLALNTTGITIIAAPGANKAIDVKRVTLYYKYGTAAYSSVVDMKLYYGSRIAGNAASSAITASGLIDQTADKVASVLGTPENTLESINTAVVIMNTTGVAIGGGSATTGIRVVADYRVRKKAGA